MSYQHITRMERVCIDHLRRNGFSYREIGSRLGRHHTTIIREMERNNPENRCQYSHQAAQMWVDRRRCEVRCYRKQDNPEVVKYVEVKIRLEWSPQQIAERIRIDHPDNDSMRISVETIYRWIYMEARTGGKLYRHLRRSHKWRRRQKRYGSGRRFISGRVDIEERPEEANSRQRFGDWEGDSVVGKRGRTTLATHVERKSRYLMVGKLEDRSSAAFKAKTVNMFEKVEPSLRKTLTLDNGSEGARFNEIEKETGLAVYFAKPYSAWQRGTNENTNGLLRQYFPKGTDFRKVSDDVLQRVVDRLNSRPRKCLNYRTPYEVFSEASGGALAI